MLTFSSFYHHFVTVIFEFVNLFTIHFLLIVPKSAFVFKCTCKLVTEIRETIFLFSILVPVTIACENTTISFEHKIDD